MNEQADYYIYSMHYSTTHKHIEKVLTTTSLYTKNANEMRREDIVKDINDNNKIIYSAPPDGIWLKKGAKEITEKLNGKYYIRTVPDGREEDNLDALSTY
jgi:hypothetical protein